MNKFLTIASAIVLSSTMLVSDVFAGGIFANIRANIQARQQRARVQSFNNVRVQKVIVNDRVRVRRNVIRIPVRTTRIVEVPDLQVREEVLITRDRYGNIVDVRKQRVLDAQKNRGRQVREKVIIRQEIRGY